MSILLQPLPAERAEVPAALHLMRSRRRNSLYIRKRRKRGLYIKIEAHIFDPTSFTPIFLGLPSQIPKSKRPQIQCDALLVIYCLGSRKYFIKSERKPAMEVPGLEESKTGDWHNYFLSKESPLPRLARGIFYESPHSLEKKGSNSCQNCCLGLLNKPLTQNHHKVSISY